MKRLIPLLLLALLAAPAAANAAPRVYAAASLRDAFPQIDSAPTYNFAGSNQLQPQIQQRRAGRRLRVGEPEGGPGAVQRRAAARAR